MIAFPERRHRGKRRGESREGIEMKGGGQRTKEKRGRKEEST